MKESKSGASVIRIVGTVLEVSWVYGARYGWDADSPDSYIAFKGLVIRLANEKRAKMHIPLPPTTSVISCPHPHVPRIPSVPGSPHLPTSPKPPPPTSIQLTPSTGHHFDVSGSLRGQCRIRVSRGRASAENARNDPSSPPRAHPTHQPRTSAIRCNVNIALIEAASKGVGVWTMRWSSSGRSPVHPAPPSQTTHPPSLASSQLAPISRGSITPRRKSHR